jgi:hypothetical protein
VIRKPRDDRRISRGVVAIGPLNRARDDFGLMFGRCWG